MTDQTTQEPDSAPTIALRVDGVDVEVPDVGDSLLGALRDHLGANSVKDGCSPQGQCGCCTVLVDGKPRVACVTPVRRVRGRSVTTLDGIDPGRRERWADAFCATGASQCGFCTPGIVVRLDALAASLDGNGSEGGAEPELEPDPEIGAKVDQALLAHLCRCTGWQTIHEAFNTFVGAEVGAGVADTPVHLGAGGDDGARDLEAAARRAEIEGGTAQSVSPEVALGRGRFAADTAPDDALIAVPGPDGWVVGETLFEARQVAGKVQGRRTTAEHGWPLDVPDGDWVATLRTTWVDPGYLETDASWCEPGREPWSPVANGGAFGAKWAGAPESDGDSDRNADGAADGFAVFDVAGTARRLADEHGRTVLALAGREDVIRNGPKRPPVAGGMTADGIGILRAVATPGLVEAVAAVAPGLVVEEVEVPGPPTSVRVRAAGWAEAVVLSAGATGRVGVVTAPGGGEAEAAIAEDGTIRVSVRCGSVLDATVLRSYCIGAAHMAWSWLTGEALTVDADGVVHDLTVRSLGILRAVDTPPIEVEIRSGDGDPVNGSDAVFAAVAAAGWLARGRPQDWPIGF